MYTHTYLQRRFPDFSYIAEGGRLTEHLDCVIIRWMCTNTQTHKHTHTLTSLPPSLPPSHFHLDHCGALPYFTEMVGYDGPLYMTQPTKAICPILLVRMCVCVCVYAQHKTPGVSWSHICPKEPTATALICDSSCGSKLPLTHLCYPLLLPSPPHPSLPPPLPSPPPPFPPPCLCRCTQEDYRKITVEKKGETNFFTSQMIKDCMKKVTAVSLHQTVKVGHLALNMRSCILPTLPSPHPSLPLTPPLPLPPQVDEELEIKAYYAGHVLGAAMFLVRVGTRSFVYTVSGRAKGLSLSKHDPSNISHSACLPRGTTI